jgi:dihydrofolate reductase
VPTSAVDHVRALKVQAGGDIGIHGSTRLARSLLRADLVDRLELVVAPSVAGRGARRFDVDDELHLLSLERVERTPAGSLFLTYQLPSA